VKHAILGAGAIGGIMATALASLGENVTLIVRAASISRQPATLLLERPSGNLTAGAKYVARLTEPMDVLWIATKTYQLEEALKSIETMPGIVVPLLNGVDHIPVLRARFGRDRVVPATIAVEAERTAPGVFAQHTPVRLDIASSGEPVLTRVAVGLQGLGFACRFIADEPTLLWTKLCFLEPFALVTAASSKTNGQIQADARWKSRLDSAVREACAVAAKEGAQVDADKIIAAFPKGRSEMRASMAKDLAAGRRLELDGIAGPVLRLGAHQGVPTPVTQELVAIVEAAEQTARHP